jgi:hypothetical protein
MDDRPVRMPQTALVGQSPPRRQVETAVPALYNLSRTKVLPEQFALIGVARAEATAESCRDHLYDRLKNLSATPPRSSMSTTSRGSGPRREWCVSGAT